MTLQDDPLLDNIFESNVNLRKHVMISTTMTTKLLMLLDMLQQEYQEKRVTQLAAELRVRCKKCLHDSICASVKECMITPDILRLAANLYSLYDNVLITATIPEKISAWKIACSIARQQHLDLAPFSLSIPQLPESKIEYCKLTPIQISDELLDYADEIDAWLNGYFDEYDEYSEDKEFDVFVCILTDLQFLANVIQKAE